MNHTTSNPENTPENRHKRRIRSFVTRPGRLTKGQQQALALHWQTYGLEMPTKELDLQAIFQRDNPKILEIGYGMGKSLITMAENTPEQDFIGIEVHTPGVGALIALAQEKSITNLKTLHGDAIEVMQHIPSNSLQRVQLFFPDPWHKKRHNKRRIVNEDFAESVRRILKIGGQLHMATDWEPYMQHMLEIMDNQNAYKNIAGNGHSLARPDYRPLTKFELRGEQKGHGVWDLIYQRLR